MRTVCVVWVFDDNPTFRSSKLPTIYRHVDSRLADVNQTAEEISRERAGVEPEFEREQVFSHHLGPVSFAYLLAEFIFVVHFHDRG